MVVAGIFDQKRKETDSLPATVKHCKSAETAKASQFSNNKLLVVTKSHDLGLDQGCRLMGSINNGSLL